MKIIGITSGYFNPIHYGHVLCITESAKSCDFLVVIVNNDRQQILKKGQIIMEENERMNIVQSIKGVDETILSIDDDRTVCKTLEFLARKYPEDKLIFFKGGDRSSRESVPESEICDKCGIDIVFDAGGNEKVNSSSNINKLRGIEKN